MLSATVLLRSAITQAEVNTALEKLLANHPAIHGEVDVSRGGLRPRSSLQEGEGFVVVTGDFAPPFASDEPGEEDLLFYYSGYLLTPNRREQILKLLGGNIGVLINIDYSPRKGSQHLVVLVAQQLASYGPLLLDPAWGVEQKPFLTLAEIEEMVAIGDPSPLNTWRIQYERGEHPLAP